MLYLDIGYMLTILLILRLNFIGKALSEKQREEEGLSFVNFWLDVIFFEQSKRKSRNFVDSDILVIINSSDVSIFVISSDVSIFVIFEFSVEIIFEFLNKYNVDDGFFVILISQKSDKREVDSVIVLKSLNLNGIVEEEELIFVGLLLFNSICFSMVFSVYENFLFVNDNQEILFNKDLFQFVINNKIDVENNNGNISNQFQLNGKDDFLDNNFSSYEICEQNSIQDSISFNLQVVVNRINGLDSFVVRDDLGFDWLKNFDN